MPVNFELYQDFVDNCSNVIGQGMQLDTYIKPCFFLYEEDPVNGIIKIDDASIQNSFYDALTDVHEVFITITNESGVVCYTSSITPFGNLSFVLPEPGCYTVEVDVRYTIQYDDMGNIVPHTFQNVLMYPIEWNLSGNYHNSLLYDITCRISSIQCEINKRSCVGRAWTELQNRIYMLNNYLYAICNFCLSVKEFDQIVCKINKIKKVC